MPRKKAADRLKELEDRIAGLKRQQQQLSSRVKTDHRRREARRKIIVGALVLTHATHDAAFHSSLRAALTAAFSAISESNPRAAARDRSFIEDLLEG